MNNLNFIPVESSTIASMAHDPEENKMYVRFKKGAGYVYENVPVETFNLIINDKVSVGKAFNTLVKTQPNKYPYRVLPA